MSEELGKETGAVDYVNAMNDNISDVSTFDLILKKPLLMVGVFGSTKHYQRRPPVRPRH